MLGKHLIILHSIHKLEYKALCFKLRAIQLPLLRSSLHLESQTNAIILNIIWPSTMDKSAETVVLPEL